jgi:hypothetical protein
MHPLAICDFDPALIADLDPYDTKQLMTQLCINKMKLGMSDPKEVFNDEDFVNKVRFHKTEKIITAPSDGRDIWEVKPDIDKMMFVQIPQIPQSPGTYVCKATFSGKTYIEHFIIINSILPYMSFRVKYEVPYADNIYNCIQTFIANNKFGEHQHSALIKYLTCKRDYLDLELDPSDPLFTFNLLRVSMESIKRIAYV